MIVRTSCSATNLVRNILCFLLYFHSGRCFSCPDPAILTLVELTDRPMIAHQVSRKGEVVTLHDGAESYDLSLMISFGDSFLCAFPRHLRHHEQTINMTLPNMTSSNSLAVAVRLGGCSLQTKLNVAIDIQQRVAAALKYVLFYESKDSDILTTLAAVPQRDSFESFYKLDDQSLHLATKTQKDAIQLQHRIHNFLNASTLSNSHITRLQQMSRDNDVHTYARIHSSNFVWFRTILFTLLIVSPCCRTGYLWWAAGGRIQFRRNDQDQIVGLQYIPPMQYWYATTITYEHGTSLIDVMTKQEVLALPEMEYTQPQSCEHDRVVSRNVSLLTIQGDGPGDCVSKTQENDKASRTFVTSCTMCSICIDDFESGERIRVLPRCRHAFHTDCIMPWLTGKQGYCPLCKSSVLGRDETQANIDSNHSENLVEASTVGVSTPMIREEHGVNSVVGSLIPLEISGNHASSSQMGDAGRATLMTTTDRSWYSSEDEDSDAIQVVSDSESCHGSMS